MRTTEKDAIAEAAAQRTRAVIDRLMAHLLAIRAGVQEMRAIRREASGALGYQLRSYLPGIGVSAVAGMFERLFNDEAMRRIVALLEGLDGAQR